MYAMVGSTADWAWKRRRAALGTLLSLSLGLAAGCGGGSDASADPVPSDGRQLPLSRICQTLNRYVSAEPGAAAPAVSGYSFVLFDVDATLLTCSGGDQTLGAAQLIASASKLASAAAIMTLVDEGRLDLDTSVATYLAGSEVAWPADKTAITMRMLLSHTSGLPGLGDASAPVCLYQPTQLSLASCVQQVADTALISAPGVQFNYGAASYQVAGYIATLLSGQRWQDFFAARIAGPLDMPTFTYGDAATVGNPGIAGGASSSALDYAKLLKVFLAGGEPGVLSASAVDEMETDQIGSRPIAYMPLAAGSFPGYTLGFFISSPSLHPGSVGPEFSDPGLYGTVPWIDLAAGYGAVLVIRSDSPTGLSMWNAVRPQILDALQQSRP